MDLCIQHAEDARRAQAAGNLEESAGNAKIAIFHLVQHLGESARPLVERSGSARAGWIEALRFLDGCQIFRGLGGLSLALAELDRGVTSPALSPVGGRRGGKSSTASLYAIRQIVEGVAQLRRKIRAQSKLAKGDKPNLEDILMKLGTSIEGVKGFQRTLKSAPPECQPRRSYLLVYGPADPEEVIREGVRAYGLARTDSGEK